MHWYAQLCTASLFVTALASPIGHVLHEKRATPNRHVRRRVQPDAYIPMRIALKQSNLEHGHEKLMEVSRPDSARFGQHYTAEEVADFFAPSKDALDTVMEWLASSGINPKSIKQYANRGWLAIDMPASKAEELFSTTYYEHDVKDHTRLGCDEYYLPAHVSKHIDLIKPGIVMSPRVKKRNVKSHKKRQWGGWPGSPPSGPPEWPAPSWPNNPGWPGYPGPPRIPVPSGSGGLPADLSACGYNITPPCIKALYGIPQVPPYTSPENVLGFYESGDTFSQEDLNLFFAKYVPNVPQNTTPVVYSVDGGAAPVAVHSPLNMGESDTDLELAYSLVYPQTIAVYQVDDIPNAVLGTFNKTGFLNDFFDAVDGSYCNYTAYGITGNSPSIDPVYPDPAPGGYKGDLMCGTYELTRVVSISYGNPEQYYPKNYLERQCSEIMKLGMQGHSILTAAGDYGVASFPNDNNNTYGCLSGGSGAGPGLINQVYNPDWPSACPYMTAVGGTRLYPGQTVDDPESVMQVNLTAFNIATGEGQPLLVLQYFASGGGFSNYFPIPDYQYEAVTNYINTQPDLPPSYVVNSDATNLGENGGLWNRVGRGYPDVAANGAFLEIFNNGTNERIFGTSLSSPIFASVLTLLNEERTHAGKGPVGFVNPVLYANPQVLNDVTNGSNPNCGSQGFHAAKGWDPTTGLGTPNYPKMLELYMSLP